MTRTSSVSWASLVPMLVTLVGLLVGALQQFYALKSDFEALKLRVDYIHGVDWRPGETARRE